MRKNMLKKLLAGMLVGTMLIGSLAGCGANEVNSSENTNVSETQKTSTSETQNVATEVVEEGVTYPLDSDETLTLAMVKDSYVAAGGYKDLSETPFFKAWTEATGVDVEVITVENDDAMSLMLAGDELPDMLLWVPGNYSGGASAMIKDEILSPLTWDELNKWAPDLAAAIGEDDVRRAVSTADGEVIGFPCLRLDSTLVATGGLMCRADWLEDLGLGVPTTPDELLTVLRAFKTEKGAEYPLALSSTRMTLLFSGGLFSSAFGLVNGSSYQIDGELHHGWAEPEYKDLLAFMHQLYEEELINPDYQTVNQATINAMIYDGRAGMTQHSIGAVWVLICKQWQMIRILI